MRLLPDRPCPLRFPNPFGQSSSLRGPGLFVTGELQPNLEPLGVHPLDEERFATVMFRLDLGRADRLFVIVHATL